MANETQTTNPFFAASSDNAEFERLEDGVYNGVCVGVVSRKFKDYNDPSKLVDKVQYIFQVAADGQCNYFRSKPLRPVINEKSNLFLLLVSWCGATLERIGGGFDYSCMVGQPAQLVINTATSKEGKSYANLANVLKVKKGTKVPVTPDAIPAYLAKEATGMVLAEGITVKEEKAKTASFPTCLPGGINDQLPGVIPQQPAVPQTQIPQMPPAAKVTQNGNPAAFMGVTNPPAQPETGVVQEGDDDSDLPF